MTKNIKLLLGALCAFLLLPFIGFLFLFLIVFIADTDRDSTKITATDSKEEKVTTANSDKKVYTTYQEACRNEDYDAAHSILEKKRDEFEKFKEENELVIKIVKKGIFSDDISYDHSNEEKYNTMVKNYEDGMNYVFNAEMLYLTSQNTEESSNRILYLLAESKIPGTPTTAGREYRGRDYENAKKYIEGIARFNNRCNSVLDMAIAQKNEKLANGVVKLMKQNVDVEREWTGLGELKVSSKGVNNTDIDIAKKKLEDAIKSGAFK